MDYESYLEIYPPREFSFEECLMFLNRSDQEILHQMMDGFLYKLIEVEKEFILLKIGYTPHSIQVEFPVNRPSENVRKATAAYVWEWFDMGQDLPSFYEAADRCDILNRLVHKYDGLRMVCMPDLFEALVWAIIGQQINLTFAYTLKKRFVEQFGECLSFERKQFWLFPSFEKIAGIDIDDLKSLQITARKAEYIIGVAKAMLNGEIIKENMLQKLDYQQAKQSLMAIRGVGAWTADYVLMKCLHYTCAFPIADVGLHNALKKQLGLAQKPTIEEINHIAANWEGWEAYATFYLWRSLYE
nr:DNA-3-methyladenine glycosylase [Cytobacillus massiliigabonensis]